MKTKEVIEILTTTKLKRRRKTKMKYLDMKQSKKGQIHLKNNKRSVSVFGYWKTLLIWQLKKQMDEIRGWLVINRMTILSLETTQKKPVYSIYPLNFPMYTSYKTFDYINPIFVLQTHTINGLTFIMSKSK